MEVTEFINFGTLGTELMPVVTTGVGAAVAIGASILAAKLVWRFFKGFARG